MIPDTRAALEKCSMDDLCKFRSELENERLAHAAKTKLVNDLIAEREEALRIARGPNPLGVGTIGKK